MCKWVFSPFAKFVASGCWKQPHIMLDYATFHSTKHYLFLIDLILGYEWHVWNLDFFLFVAIISLTLICFIYLHLYNHRRQLVNNQKMIA